MEAGSTTGCGKAVGVEAGFCTTGGGKAGCCIVVATLVGKLVVQVVEPSLVVGRKKVGKLAVAYLVCLWPSAGEALCKLEVGTPT